MRTRIELYTDDIGRHRWRKKAANYFVVGASTQGYTAQRSAIHNLEEEQGGLFYPDQLRRPLGGRRFEEAAPPRFVHGKRRLGVLRRVTGQELVVLELEPKR